MGQLGDVADILAAQPLILDQLLVDGLQPDRLEPVDDLRDMIAGRGDVVVVHDDGHPLQHGRGQHQRGLQDRHAGALGADQRAGDVEALLGQQLIQVVPGHPARQPVDRRIALADRAGVAVPQVAQPGVDLAFAAAGRHDRVELVFLAVADPETLAVVGDHFQRVGVVRGARPRTVQLGLHGMHAAGVVAHVAADGAPGVRRRIRPEDQAAPAGRPVELLVDDPGFRGDQPPVYVDVPDLGQVLGVVDDHGVVDGFPGQAGAAAPVHDRRAEVRADPVGGDDVVQRLRDDHADGHLAEVGAVVRVHGLGRGVEPHLALNDLPQAAFEAADVDDRRSALAAGRPRAGPGGLSALAGVAGLGHWRRFRRGAGVPGVRSACRVR